MNFKLERNEPYSYERVIECVGKRILMCKIRVSKGKYLFSKHIYYNNKEKPENATVPPLDISVASSNGLIQQITFFITEPCAICGMPRLSFRQHEGFICVEDERFTTSDELDLVGIFRPYFYKSSLCICNNHLPDDKMIDMYSLGTSNQIGFDNKGNLVKLVMNNIIQKEYKQMIDAGVIG